MSKRIAKHGLVWLTTLAISVGVFLVPPADAHIGGTAPVGGRGTATIDGHLASGEWVDAGTVALDVKIGAEGTTPGRVLIMNDDQNLYIAMWVDVRDVPTSVIFSSFVVEFDNHHSAGPREEGDDVFVADPAGTLFDDYRTYLPPCPPAALCGLLDTDDGGTNDGHVVVVRTASEVVYEISKPLDSTDDAHDFSLRPGDVVGFWLDLQVFTPSGAFDTTYPFFVPAPPLMADLRIVGATPDDETAPSIMPTILPEPNANGWNRTPTTVSWSVADLESGVAISSGCDSTTLSADTAAFTLICTATNGAGLTTSASVTVHLDTTAPTIAFTGNDGTYAVDQSVAITCSASDSLSGLPTPNDCGAISGPAYSFPIRTSTYERSVTDRAGNTATASTTINVVVTSEGLCNLTTSFVSQHGVANALCATLAAGSYNAYRNQIAAQTGEAIPPREAEILLALVAQL